MTNDFNINDQNNEMALDAEIFSGMLKNKKKEEEDKVNPEDLKHLEEDVKIEEKYLEHLFHHNKH